MSSSNTLKKIEWINYFESAPPPRLSQLRKQLLLLSRKQKPKYMCVAY
jgi:hypothetical protein